MTYAVLLTQHVSGSVQLCRQNPMKHENISTASDPETSACDFGAKTQTKCPEACIIATMSSLQNVQQNVSCQSFVIQWRFLPKLMSALLKPFSTLLTCTDDSMIYEAKLAPKAKFVKVIWKWNSHFDILLIELLYNFQVYTEITYMNCIHTYTDTHKVHLENGTLLFKKQVGKQVLSIYLCYPS